MCRGGGSRVRTALRGVAVLFLLAVCGTAHAQTDTCTTQRAMALRLLWKGSGIADTRPYLGGEHQAYITGDTLPGEGADLPSTLTLVELRRLLEVEAVQLLQPMEPVDSSAMRPVHIP